MAKLDTHPDAASAPHLPDRQTINVSLPEAQDRFVRTQVASGRFRSASEVLREGLRLLEQAEHQRLVEKWQLREGLTKAEQGQVPADLIDRAARQVRALVDVAIEDVRQGRVVDRPSAMKLIRRRVRGRGMRASA